MPKTPKEKKIKKIFVSIATMLAVLLSMLSLKRREEQIDIAKISLRKPNKKSSQGVEENDDEDQNQMRIGRDKNGIMWNYKLDGQGNAINVNYHSGILADIVIIPDELDGHAVISVGNDEENILNNYSFTLVNKIVLPETVRKIEDYAFENCKYLKEVTIPEEVISIGKNVFLGCENIKNRDLSNIQDNKEFIEETINLIEEYEKIEVTKISANKPNSHMSEEIDNLGENQNQSYTYVDQYGNFWTYKLDEQGNAINVYTSNQTKSTLIVPETMNGHTVISVGTDGQPYHNMIYDGYNQTLKKVVLPNTLISIGDNTFHYCKELIEINIPEGVTNIGDSAFYGCSSLTQINIPDGVTSIGNSAFSQCSNLEQINIPERVTSIGNSVFCQCSNLKQINIPEGVTNIGDSAFIGCSSLTQVNIPEGVTSIGNLAFSYCSNLEQINIQEGVTNIGDSAFIGCSSLTQINIPEGVTSIGKSAFSKCTNLENVSLPSSLENLGNDSNVFVTINCVEGVFSYCTSLKNIAISGNIETLGAGTFYKCTNLKNVSLPDSLKTIGQYAFFECSYLTDVKMSNTLENIENNAFFGCGWLWLDIPESVKKIGEDAFTNCTISNVPSGLEEAVWGSFSTTYMYIFNDTITYKSTKEIDLPNGLKRAFKENDILYANGNVEFYNCHLNEDNTKLVINDDLPYYEEVRIKINGGKLRGLNVQIAGIVKYSEENFTRDNVNVSFYITRNIKMKENCASSSYFAENGSYKFEYIVDNRKEMYITAKVTNIDKKDPTVEVIPDKTEWTKDNIILNITANDNEGGSGVKDVKIQKIGEEQTSLVENGMYEVTDNGTYIITAEDNVGNMATKEIEITNIDRVSPELMVTLDIIDGNEEQSILTVNTIDRQSGIDKITIEKLNEEEYKIISSDKVGNIAEKILVVKNFEITTNIKTTLNKDGSVLEEITFSKGKVSDEPTEPSGDNPVVEIIIKDLEIILKNGKKYVKVLPGFTTEELTSKMDEEALLGEVPEYTDLTEDGSLRTGSKIMLKGKEEYIVVVKGDINGDGKVDFINDVIKINNYRLERINNLTEEQILAGDINNNEKIDFIDDIISINNYRLGRTKW